MRRVEAGGNVVTILVSAEESDGAVGIIEYQPKPGPTPGAPHHHTRESWSAFVLEGRARIRLEDSPRELRRGDVVHVPRGRAFQWEEAEEGTRMLFVYTPGGFERYFVEIAELFGTGRPFAELLPRIVALSEKYGIERQS